VIRCIRLSLRLSDDESRALKVARDDLRIAANAVMRDLYLREQEEPDGVAPHTYAYRRLGGVKGLEPAYVPTGEPVGGGVRSAVATHCYARWRTDRRDVARGEKSLATFRRLPLMLRRQEARVVDHEHVEMLVWGKPNPRWVRAECWPAGRRQRKTWRQIARGKIRHGDLKLQLDRLGRWYGLLAYEEEPETISAGAGGVVALEVRGGSLAGLHLRSGGKTEALDYPPPCNFWRLWEEWLRWRREVGRCARKDYELREGRGRARKLAPLGARREKYERRIEDACRIMARAAVNYASSEGAAIAITAQIGRTEEQQDESEDVRPRETRAELRSRFLRRNRQRLMDRVRTAAESAGVRVAEVSAAKLHESDDPLREIARRGYVAVGLPVVPEGDSDAPLVAEGEAEGHESRAASGDVIADSRQALDVSARSRVTTRDRSASKGAENAQDRGSRCEPRKRRARKDLRGGPRSGDHE